MISLLLWLSNTTSPDDWWRGLPCPPKWGSIYLSARGHVYTQVEKKNKYKYIIYIEYKIYIYMENMQKIMNFFLWIHNFDTISLSGDLVDSVPNRFSRFVLVAENSDGQK